MVQTTRLWPKTVYQYFQVLTVFVLVLYLYYIILCVKRSAYASSRSVNAFSTISDTSDPFENIWESLRLKISCDSRILRSRAYKRGSYWVLENYIAAERKDVKCYQSVTYTTHTDYNYLDNLIPVVERWMAPVSIAIYTPGHDLQHTKDAIYYLRNCLANQRQMKLIKELVSFHLYFPADHMPPANVNFDKHELNLDRCVKNPMETKSFKTSKKLLYPINVGRNVARDAAATHFIFASDIELYPSPGMVSKFLTMIAKESGNLPKYRVFPVAIYEVATKVPDNKTELVQMLQTGEAIRFHAKICPKCHSVPGNDKWESSPEAAEMKIFVETRRSGKYHHWEPIHIGSKNDPYYDERLPWEGMSDKMTQGYVFCVQNYKMSLLSDAFLTHRPGFKTVGGIARPELYRKSKELIKRVIRPELIKIYGSRLGCYF